MGKPACLTVPVDTMVFPPSMILDGKQASTHRLRTFEADERVCVIKDLISLWMPVYLRVHRHPTSASKKLFILTVY